MTPAEHYAATEAVLAEINKTSEDAKPRIEKMLADGAYEQAREAAAVMAEMVQLGLTRAQVHATLATVDPQLLGMRRPPVVVRPPGCICSTLAAEPLAKTAMHPDCPVHEGR